MARVVASGKQDFAEIIANDYFYVDKTNFIKEWWDSGNDVTLITRPRRFGKTLTMNMVERFFSVKYQGQGELFEGLDIWKNEKYRQLQGAYPVISLSFADVKGNTYEEAHRLLCRIIYEQYDQYKFLLDVNGLLSAAEKELFHAVSRNMEDDIAAVSLKTLSKWLKNYYSSKVIILLDEYDTPMQEAYVYGYWDRLVSFFRGLFNSTFKANQYLERAIMTGITRISKESVFSDLNNLEVVTVTSGKYRDSFGFTQEEVSDALREFELSDREETVRDWYDGFTFGGKTDIYNPWSIANFLEKKRFQTYWVNTSSNRLVDELIRKGNAKVKMAMEDLLNGNILHVSIDEQVVFSQLNYNENAIWSLLLASGYLKTESCRMNMETGEEEYDLKLTNKEVLFMFRKMIKDWFGEYSDVSCNDFTKALLEGNLLEMNHYINRVASATFSYFDTGKKPSEKTEPERFYHGFILGLIVDLSNRYEITSNRESGLGRYDVMLKPRRFQDGSTPAIILEFKVFNPKREKDLEETVEAALSQIKEKRYAATLVAEGIPEEDIREYAFAFEGENVRIDGGSMQEVEEILKRMRKEKQRDFGAAFGVKGD